MTACAISRSARRLSICTCRCPTGPATRLLAVFFFVAGLELKRELTIGSLRRPADAMLPIGAALVGMTVPALIYLFITRMTLRCARLGNPHGNRHRVLPGRARRRRPGLPAALRAFLLTLAVVDDLSPS